MHPASRRKRAKRKKSDTHGHQPTVLFWRLQEKINFALHTWHWVIERWQYIVYWRLSRIICHCSCDLFDGLNFVAHASSIIDNENQRDITFDRHEAIKCLVPKILTKFLKKCFTFVFGRPFSTPRRLCAEQMQNLSKNIPGVFVAFAFNCVCQETRQCDLCLLTVPPPVINCSCVCYSFFNLVDNFEEFVGRLMNTDVLRLALGANNRPRWINSIGDFAGFSTTRENPNRASRVNRSEPKRFPLQLFVNIASQKKATSKKSATYTVAISTTDLSWRTRFQKTQIGA